MATIVAKTKYYNGNNGGTSSPINTTGASLLVVLLASYGTPGATSVSDSKSNVWHPLTLYGPGSTSAYSRIFYVDSPTVGADHTFTFVATNAWPTIMVYALSGMQSGAAVYEVSGGHNDNTTGNITPVHSSDVLFSTFTCGYGGSYVPDAAWTVDYQQPYNSGVCVGAASAIINPYQSVNPIGCTWSSYGVNQSSAIVAFRQLDAISIDWAAKIIHVSREGMALVQTDPFEVRSLDLNNFRLSLKDLEDGEEGMAFPDTHRHNTEVSVGGVTLSRVIEIINGYTVTFEDGQYAVNLTGANSNIADVVNLNQVSVRSQNSAGLVLAKESETISQMSDFLLDDRLVTQISTILLDGQNIESGISFRNSHRLQLAALAGLLSGAEGATISIKNAKSGGGGVVRIVAVTDQYGNRTELSFDFSEDM